MRGGQRIDTAQIGRKPRRVRTTPVVEVKGYADRGPGPRGEGEAFGSHIGATPWDEKVGKAEERNRERCDGPRLATMVVLMSFR